MLVKIPSALCVQKRMCALKSAFVCLLFAFLLTACAAELAMLPGSSFDHVPAEHLGHPEHTTTKAPFSDSGQRDESRKLLDRFAYATQAHEAAGDSARRDDDSNVASGARSGARDLATGSGSAAILKAAPFNSTELDVPLFSVEAVSAPLQAVLFSLANDAGLQLKLHGTFDDRVTLNAQDQAMDEVLQTLADQAGFSWDRTPNSIELWSGDAYSKSYPVNYLNVSRLTQSSVGLATRVGTINASDGNGSSIANSSQTRIENTSQHDFWQALADDVQSLISQAKDSDAPLDSQVSINREAGLISLYSTPEVHRDLQRYLVQLHGSAQRQVLIEATVVEVALSNSYSAGVDWQVLAGGVNGINAAQVLVGAPAVSADSVGRLTAPSGLATLIHKGGTADIMATLSLLEQFGDVSILSRPRIIAMNNQSSVLKVVDNRVYFTVNVQRIQNDEKDEVVTETEIHTVPVGLVMNVTPQISEEGVVMLNVRPTLSRILGFVNDPNPELALANVQNGVPEIQVREMESMLQVSSGDMAIIGGLMQETGSDKTERIPLLGSLPVVGNIFSNRNRQRRQTELLIVLRPTVIEQSKQAAFR